MGNSIDTLNFDRETINAKPRLLSRQSKINVLMEVEKIFNDIQNANRDTFRKRREKIRKIDAELYDKPGDSKTDDGDDDTCNKDRLKILLDGSRAGNPKCIVNLGLYYEKQRDFDKAFLLYLNAARLFNSFGLYNLGRCYETGIGCKINWAKAADSYKRGVELGSEHAFNRLKYVAQTIYAKGVGVKKDKKKAKELELFLRSHSLGGKK